MKKRFNKRFKVNHYNPEINSYLWLRIIYTRQILKVSNFSTFSPGFCLFFIKVKVVVKQRQTSCQISGVILFTIYLHIPTHTSTYHYIPTHTTTYQHILPHTQHIFNTHHHIPTKYKQKVVKYVQIHVFIISGKKVNHFQELCNTYHTFLSPNELHCGQIASLGSA